MKKKKNVARMKGRRSNRVVSGETSLSRRRDLIASEDANVDTVPAELHAPRTPQCPRSQSLHRAVSIRSAHRAFMQPEREDQEEMEMVDEVVGLTIDKRQDEVGEDGSEEGSDESEEE